MADWYVDSSATGTNSGTSPTNAAIDINSLSFGASVNWGDRIWVRRTMPWQANSFVCQRSGFNQSSHAPLEIIGWPSSGDPYYEDRPAAGASAWDADAALYSNLPWPVLATSGTNGQAMFTLAAGHFLSNFLFVSSIALSRIVAFENNFGSNPQGATRAGKLAFLNVHPRCTNAMYADEVTYCMSGLASTNGCGIGSMRRFVVTQSCVGEPLFSNEINIGDYINLSNSIAFWAVNSGLNERYLGGFIGNISGNDVTNPDRPFATVAADGYRTPFPVGNYLGRGPAIIHWSFGGLNMRAAVGSTAVYSGGPTTQIAPNSYGNANDSEIGNYNYDDIYEHIGQAISVRSGTRITAKFFFKHVGVGSLEANRLGWIQLTGLGGGRKTLSQQTASGGIYAGDNALWTGTSVAVGSAYYGQGIWTPTETTTAYLFARAPFPLGFGTPNSGQLYVACFMEVTTG